MSEYRKIDLIQYHHTVNNINEDLEEGHIYETVKFYGFIRKIRIAGGGSIAFVDIQDGTKVGVINCIFNEDNIVHDKIVDHTDEEFEIIDFKNISNKLSRGSAIVVYGKLVKSPEKATQYFDLQIDKLLLIGKVDSLKFSIPKSLEKDLIGLRFHPHERMFSQISQSLFRIRSTLDYMISKFFFERKVIKTDPNIITINDCEGAGETFQIANSIFGKEKFSLTVSSQLPLEATGKGFKRVYTMQKSFRAEKSDTNKHLAEFMHVEYEEYFTTLDELLDFTEDYLKTIITDTIKFSEDDYKFLDSKFAPQETRGRKDIIIDILSKPFVRIKHKDAIDLIIKIVKEKIKINIDGKEKRIKLKKLPTYFDDLSSEYEKILTSYFGTFVIVTHWPSKIKSFYMKQCPIQTIDDQDYQTCESFDILAPFVGEVFGGSMREHRYDVLDKIIKDRNMDISKLQWFLDLRKESTAPHGGWGMGFARILMLITGVPSVRDIIPFPVYYNHCPY
jgi:asparaginyl-tRNA synthetase